MIITVQQVRRFLACAFGLLAAVLFWRPVAGMAGNASAETNLVIVVRKAAPDRQSPDRQLPVRPRNAAPQAKLYFGSRVESLTTAVAPQNPYESNYASVLHSHHKAIIGFRLALIARAYLFVGVGMAIPDDILKQGWGQNVSATSSQIQNALVMQTEYGLGWEF